MIVVTSGKKYIDIDAYASSIAYANLLRLKGFEVKAITTAKLNESITPSLLDLTIKLDEYEPRKNDEYIVIDVSNKDYFEPFVKESNIIEILDHHVGYEKYWDKKLKEKAKIEFIGSVATMIVELYEKEGVMNKISKEMATLLISAILDNTLNLKARITTRQRQNSLSKTRNHH
jgi:inorganic pyrophosphatase/exopolyphosphatase